MAVPASPEKAPIFPRPAESGKVSQPRRLPEGLRVAGLESFLEDINSLEMGKVGEVMGEDTSARDTGGSGGFTAGGSAATGTSQRDLAIANLPPQQVMQKQLEKYICAEVKKLRKQTRAIARIHGPGAAYHFNRLYARIRQFNTLLEALLEASVDVLKRFFIRVFIDRQSIL